jgi:hypothetical protein
MKQRLLSFIFLLGLLNASCNSNDSSFRLKGEIRNIDTSTVLLTYITSNDDNPKVHVDTCNITNGTFLFKGNITEPESAILSYCGMDISFYIEASDMYITLDCQSNEFNLTGSKTQDDYIRMLEYSKDLRDFRDQLYNTLTDLIKKEENTKDSINLCIINKEENEINFLRDSINIEINKRNIDFIRSNSDSYISAEIFNNIIIGNLLPLKETRQLFDSLSAWIKNTTQGKRDDNLIKMQEYTLTGATAPDFSMTDIDGNLISLSGFRGSYVFLDFWASWCGPCMKAEPYIKNLYKKYESQGLNNLEILFYL